MTSAKNEHAQVLCRQGDAHKMAEKIHHNLMKIPTDYSKYSNMLINVNTVELGKAFNATIWIENKVPLPRTPPAQPLQVTHDAFELKIKKKKTI